MSDPFSAIFAICTSAKLAQFCYETAKDLNTFQVSYKGSKSTLMSVVALCEIFGNEVKYIGDWLEKTAKESNEHELLHLETLKKALDLIENSMMRLSKDIEKISASGGAARMGMAEQWIKVKYSWSEDILKKHLTALREHATLIQLILTALQLYDLLFNPSLQDLVILTSSQAYNQGGRSGVSESRRGNSHNSKRTKYC